MARRADTTGGGLVTGVLLLLAPLCCLGLPLLLAAGLSAGVAAAVGGGTVGGLVLAVALALLVVRARRRRSTGVAEAGGLHSDEQKAMRRLP